MNIIQQLKTERDVINANFNSTLQALRINNAIFIIKLINRKIKVGDNRLIWSTGSLDHVELGDCFLIETLSGLRLYNEYCEDVKPEDFMERFNYPEELLWCPEFWRVEQK